MGVPAERTRREKVARIVAYLRNSASLWKTIQTLPSECREALDYVLQCGGQVKYGELSRRFGDEAADGWWWDKKPPQSTPGQLRLRGLLFVGRTPIGGRLYKVAIIPEEVRSLITDVLSASKPAQPPKRPAKVRSAKFYHTLGA